MNKKFVKRLVSLSLCMVLIAAMALFASGCGNETASTSSVETPVASVASVPETEEAPVVESTTEAAAEAEPTSLGEGETQFAFVVVDADGNETAFDIHTDKETVGDALLELGLIAGDDSEYGLYVKTVNGITADYDTDGTYWAFYVDGEYASTGVDTTNITAGATYAFQVEKG